MAVHKFTAACTHREWCFSQLYIGWSIPPSSITFQNPREQGRAQVRRNLGEQNAK